MPEPLQRVAIAVRVVDNFGDAGVAWRLARQLRGEHGCEVDLWIDDAAVLARFVPGAAPGVRVEGVAVHALPPLHAASAPPLAPWPQLCIEAFGCKLPAPWLDAMASAQRPPVWIHLEYLSAEDWVEGAHGLPSPQPTRPLTRWFFYPGFTARTGGLLRERDLLASRDAFVSATTGRASVWSDAGLQAPAEDALLVALFCYPNPAVTALLRAWSQGPQPVHVLVPDGVCSDAIGAFLGRDPRPGTVHARGALTLGIAPFVDQRSFDRRLWVCDLAIVRGEDSFVRAQWGARPLVWHIYPQADDAHRVKLDAFLARYLAGCGAAAALAAFTRAFNDTDGERCTALWPALRERLPELRFHAGRWAGALSQTPDLATSLVSFARRKL